MLLKPLREDVAERDFAAEPETPLMLQPDGMLVHDTPQREIFVPQLDGQRTFTESQAKCFIRDAAEGVAYCKRLRGLPYCIEHNCVYFHRPRSATNS